MEIQDLIKRYEELYLTGRTGWEGAPDGDNFSIPDEKFEWGGSEETKRLYLEYKVFKKESEIEFRNAHLGNAQKKIRQGEAQNKEFKLYCLWQDQIDRELDSESA